MRKILLTLIVGIFSVSALACSGGHGVKEKEKETSQQEEERSL